MRERWFCGFEPKNSNIKKTLSFVYVTMKTWNVQYETSKRQFIKWTISGELPIGLESHQDSYFWSTRPLFSVSYYGRPCSYIFKFKKITWNPFCFKYLNFARKLDFAMDTEVRKYNKYCNNHKYSNNNISNVCSDKWVYRVAHCDPNLSPGDFLSALGAHQMYSKYQSQYRQIWKPKKHLWCDRQFCVPQ